MTAGAGRRSRSRSPVRCGCCGDPEGDGARRRRRRTQGRRTVSCGCAPDEAGDDAEGRRYWTGSPPRTPPDWRDSFQRLRRRWSDEARRRTTRRGSQDRARPANPSPGEIRALAGRNTPGAQPEYAASGPDPAPWTPEAQAAAEPTLQQRLAELQRWQEATLRVSVEAVEPNSGSRFSLAACWDPESSPNTLISSTGSDRDKARPSAIGPAAAVVEDVVESSSASSSSSGSLDESDREESDSDQLEDPLEQVWEEVDEVLQKEPIDTDEARAEVESILRASELTKGEKLAVINAALEESAADPCERRQTAESMLRRSTRSAREVADADELERDSVQFGLLPRVSSIRDRHTSGSRQSARGSKVRSLVEDYETEGTNEHRASDSRRKTEGKAKKSILRRTQRRSTEITEDNEGRKSTRGKTIKWTERSSTLVPVESRKSSIRDSLLGTELSGRKSELRQSQVPRKTGLSQKFASIFGKSFTTAPKSVYRESRLPSRPSQRRSTRRSSPWRVNSSILRKKQSSVAGGVCDEEEEPANWSMEARHGSHSSIVESDDSEEDMGARLSHGGGGGERRSTARRGSEAPRQSRRSTAAGSVYYEDEEARPLRSVKTRRPTGWHRQISRSPSADNEADPWTYPRHSGGGSFRSSAVERGSHDDGPRHSHRKSSRRSTHMEARESRVESRRSAGRVSDIDEYSTEEETRRSSSRSSIVEEGDPAERHRWSSRRRDDEDDEEGAAGFGSRSSVLSRRHSSSRRSSARRSTAHSSPTRKRSNRSGTEEHDAQSVCCCVAGDHASTPSLRPSIGSRSCTCAADMRSVSEQLASTSDFICCRCRAERDAASRSGMGDGSGSEEFCSCCLEDAGSTPSAAVSDDSLCECTCYCGDMGESAPELSRMSVDATSRWDTPGKAAARTGGVKKRDLEVELCCECLGGEETASPARKVFPASAPCIPAPCKAALGKWPRPQPTCLCDRPVVKKKKSAGKTCPAAQPCGSRCRRLCLRYGPCLAALVLWLVCAWWLYGVLRPLLTGHPRPDRCAGIYWVKQ